MKCFLILFLSLFLSERRTFMEKDLNPNSNTSDKKPVKISLKIENLRKETLPGMNLVRLVYPISRSKMKHNSRKRKGIRIRKNMKTTKGRESKINSKVASDVEGKTFSYSITKFEEESLPLAADKYNQDYSNNAGTTAEPEYFTPAARSETDCKDLPKMIPGASKEFDNVKPSTQLEKTTKKLKNRRKSSLDKKEANNN